MDRTERDLARLDAERPLPPALRDRLESALLEDAAARANGGEDTAELLAALDAPRPVPGSTRAALEHALVVEHRRRPWRLATASAAAVLLLVASAAILTRVSTSGPRPRLAAAPPSSVPAADVPIVVGPLPSATTTMAPAAVVAVPTRPRYVAVPTTTSTTFACPQNCQVAAAVAAAPPAANGPFVSSVEPGVGPTAGGTTVTVRGVGFTGATGVLFGSSPAPSFTVVSDTEVRTVSPPSPQAQTVPVYVTFPGDATSGAGNDDHFTYTRG